VVPGQQAKAGDRSPTDQAMTPELPKPNSTAEAAARPSWSERYGARHRLVRVTDLPPGITGPIKVRLYRRRDHFVLQWWDPAAKRTLSDRVDGDLVAALVRARQIEERLNHFRASGQGARRLSHEELVERFLADLRRRADAGAIDPDTAERYRAALDHYRAFCERPEVRRAFPYAAGVNRDFQLAFAAFLANRRAAPNGHAHTAPRLMKGGGFVQDTVRAMLQWAADPDRGGLLPNGFRSPFLRRAERRELLQGGPLSEPDITPEMAVAFVGACDAWQLRLFVPLLFFGLRAAEPCYLFGEYLERDWLRVPCNPDLEYRTKGRRDKRLPLLDALGPFWDALRSGGARGLLYERRAVAEGREKARLRGASLADLVAEFRRRCAAGRSPDAAQRRRLRDRVLAEAGGLGYDHVEGEFRRLAGALGWPAAATLKDFRHLFATTLANAALPEGYRRYLMGQTPGKAATVAYTHLNRLREQYADAVRREWQPLVDAVNARLRA
jgi:hypothetical protein